MRLFLKNLFFPETYKLLFINPDSCDPKMVFESVKNLPMAIIFQIGLDKSYIVDTKVRVLRKK